MRSCGDEFDLLPGDSFVLTTTRESYGPGGACYFQNASTPSMLRNVRLGRLGTGTGQVQELHMGAVYAYTRVGETCRGEYHLGLNAKDGVLRAVRAILRPDDVESCRVEGSSLTAEKPSCWDSWRVEVRDSSGEILVSTLR